MYHRLKFDVWKWTENELFSLWLYSQRQHLKATWYIHQQIICHQISTKSLLHREHFIILLLHTCERVSLSVMSDSLWPHGL